MLLGHIVEAKARTGLSGLALVLPWWSLSSACRATILPRVLAEGLVHSRGSMNSSNDRQGRAGLVDQTLNSSSRWLHRTTPDLTTWLSDHPLYTRQVKSWPPKFLPQAHSAFSLFWLHRLLPLALTPWARLKDLSRAGRCSCLHTGSLLLPFLVPSTSLCSTPCSPAILLQYKSDHNL